MGLKNYFLLLFFVSILFSDVKAQNNMPKKYQSLLWEISGNGLKKPSFLYGTMHVSDKLVFNLPDQTKKIGDWLGKKVGNINPNFNWN
jgi:uncharacterized protein YbaP (TraB family)